MSLRLRIDHCVIAVSDRERSNAFWSLLELVSYAASSSSARAGSMENDRP